MTKTYRFKKNIAFILSFLSTFGPLIVFIIMGYSQGAETKEKLCLTMTLVTAIILSLIAIMKKIHLRATVYILMIGLWASLDKLLPFIITIGVCTILDELIFTPLHKRWKEDYHTHKQIDKRL